MDFRLTINGEEAEENGEADALLVLGGEIKVKDDSQTSDLEQVSLIGLEGNGDVEEMDDERKVEFALALMGELRTADIDPRQNNFFKAVLDSYKANVLTSTSNPTEGDLTFESGS